MSMRKIGFESMLGAPVTQEASIWTPFHSTVIECKLCETKFYYHDLIEEDELDMGCECANIALKDVPATEAKFKAFIGVYYNVDYPHIYEILYEDYLKIRQ